MPNDPLAPDPNFNGLAVDEAIQFALGNIASLLEKVVPEGYGCTVLLHSIGRDSNLFYTTNIRKEDLLDALKEFVKREKV